MAISLVSNHEMRLSGIGEVTWGMTLSDIRTKIDNELPDGAKITKITLNFSGKSYNNNILKAYNEYVHCALTNSDSEAASNNEGGTGNCTNLFVYGPYEISGRGTTTLPNKSVDITKYFGEYAPHNVQNTSYSRLTIAFTSKAVYNKDETFSLSIDVTYEIPTYTITWANIDGKGGTKTTTVTRGTVPSYSGTPSSYVKDWQYINVFSGWSPSVVAATGNTTYTAQYTPKLRKYVIYRYDTNELAKGIPVSGFKTYYYNDTVTLKAEPPLHTEVSWRMQDDTFKGSSLTFKLDDDTLSKYCSNPDLNTLESYIVINIFANYKTYIVNFNESPENGGTVKVALYLDNEIIAWTVEDSMEVQYPNNALTIRADLNEGYRFVKWGDGNTDNPRSINISGNTTYTAIFEKVISTIAVQIPNEGGTISGLNIGEQTLEGGTQITLTAIPNRGYIFHSFVVSGYGSANSSLPEGVFYDNPYTEKIRHQGKSLIRVYFEKNLINNILADTSQSLKVLIDVGKEPEVLADSTKVYGYT